MPVPDHAKTNHKNHIKEGFAINIKNCLLGSQAASKPACYFFYIGALLDLFFQPEDAGNIFLKDVS
jgi:hypothetical protein